MGLFGPTKLEQELTNEIRGLRADIANLKVEREAATKERDLSKQIVDLQAKIAELRVSESRITEQHEREEREVRHEVGLLRKQVDAEREMATQEAVLKVREENLTADRNRFEEQMKFTTERFEREVNYLREIAGKLLLRLPTVEVNKRIVEGDAAVGAGNGKHPEEE